MKVVAVKGGRLAIEQTNLRESAQKLIEHARLQADMVLKNGQPNYLIKLIGAEAAKFYSAQELSCAISQLQHTNATQLEETTMPDSPVIRSSNRFALGSAIKPVVPQEQTQNPTDNRYPAYYTGHGSKLSQSRTSAGFYPAPKVL